MFKSILLSNSFMAVYDHCMVVFKSILLSNSFMAVYDHCRILYEIKEGCLSNLCARLVFAAVTSACTSVRHYVVF